MLKEEEEEKQTSNNRQLVFYLLFVCMLLASISFLVVMMVMMIVFVCYNDQDSYLFFLWLPKKRNETKPLRTGIVHLLFWSSPSPSSSQQHETFGFFYSLSIIMFFLITNGFILWKTMMMMTIKWWWWWLLSRFNVFFLASYLRFALCLCIHPYNSFFYLFVCLLCFLADVIINFFVFTRKSQLPNN